MNYLDSNTLAKANDDAVLNVYAYVASTADKKNGPHPTNGTPLKEIVAQLIEHCRNVGVYDEHANPDGWEPTELEQLNLLKNALDQNPALGEARIGNQTNNKDGLNACAFTKTNGDISVIFKGTGDGEWIDNGEGLSGIPEENTYHTYENGKIVESVTLEKDYATDQQVEALNWFNQIASENGWDQNTNIAISGHSKGGNKAQFITMHSDLVDVCYSFDGQGFSPEAIAAMREKYGPEYELRRQKIFSFSAYNDYVNVWGERLAPEEHVFFFKSPMGDDDVVGYHFMEAMLDENGKLNAQCEQGELSEYIENLSEELMAMDPMFRRYATLGAMNICQKFIGKGTPVNSDEVSLIETAAGVGVAAWPLLSNLLGTKDGYEAIGDIVRIYSDDLAVGVRDFYRDIGEKYGIIAEAGAIILSTAAVSFAVPFVIRAGITATAHAWAMNTIVALGTELKNVGVDIYTSVASFYNSVISAISGWANKKISGRYSVAGNSPYICANTASLRGYANRLVKVNQRLGSIDSRLDALYIKVGWRDLWQLLKLDLMTGRNNQVSNCAKYLNETADDLDSTERRIISIFEGV